MGQRMSSHYPDIPLENLDRFLAEDLSCAVWWSPPDGIVIGVYVECNAAAIGTADVVRRIVSRRPAKCFAVEEDGSCGCDHLCLGELERLIDEHAMASDISYFTDYDHPTHPGQAKLDELRDQWAHEMGWVG